MYIHFPNHSSEDVCARCIVVSLWDIVDVNTTQAIVPRTITKGVNVTKPGCQKKCRNLTVPYPFGNREKFRLRDLKSTVTLDSTLLDHY